MPALSGTLAQSLSVYIGSGTANSLAGSVANAAENVAWVVDASALGNVYRVTGIGSTLAASIIGAGLTVPVGCALSADEATLYVFQANGIVLGGSATSGTFAQVGTMASIHTNWTYAKDGRDGYVYMQANSGKAIYRYSLTSHTGALLVPNPGNNNASASNGLGIYTDGSIRTFVSMQGGQGTFSVLSKYIPDQGRFEVVGGLGTEANTDGEAFLVSAFDVNGDVEIDSTGVYVYGGTGQGGLARVRLITGGNVSSLNVGSGWGGALNARMWMLRTANKLILTNGTSIGVIT